MTGLWPCRCGCYRAGAQETAEATYADNLDAAREREASEDIAAGRTTVAMSTDEFFAKLGSADVTYVPAEQLQRLMESDEPASRGRYRRWGTVRRAAFEGVTVVRWADDTRQRATCAADQCPECHRDNGQGGWRLCAPCASDGEHIIRGTE